MLPPEATGALVLAIWVTALSGWALGLRWEATHHTEARRREIEAERVERATAGDSRIAPRVWALAARLIVVIVPGLFVIDALVSPIEPLRTPWLAYTGPFALWLQVLGVICSGIGLVILVWVGRILAVHVYRRAVHERTMLTAGIYGYIRHPLYLHFYLLPIGLVLLTLNGAILPVLVGYLTLEGPTLPTKWMRDEEEEMLERHGTAYAAYMARTGRVLPRPRLARSTRLSRTR